MKQIQTVISTYTADVSGVCSALFELGGMTVMHDASGCNSTYNTHDEGRWFDHDSLVFISGLSEMEAIMGDDEKLIGDIVEAAGDLKPRFVAVAGTPIPMMTGCDIPAIARQIEYRTGIPSFGFQTNGMHSYVCGAGDALCAYADRFMLPAEKKPRSVNILGATPLDFSLNGATQSMKRRIEDSGFKLISSFAMDCTFEEADAAAEASVNLVVSSAGLKTAKLLHKKFGTPYVIGTPYGDKLASKLAEALELSEIDGQCRSIFSDFCPEGRKALIIGESVTSRSLARAISLEHGIECNVLCPIEVPHGILSAGDIQFEDEDDIRRAAESAEIIIADPLYRPILPGSAKFYPLAHEAFSGRLYRKTIPNLIERI